MSFFPLVDDVLPDIFANLDDSRDRGSRRTLFALALSCRRFSRPALDVLWRSLPDDFPLVALLHTLDIAKDRDNPPHDDKFFSQRMSIMVLRKYLYLFHIAWVLTSWVQTVGHLDSTADLHCHPMWAHFQSYARCVEEITIFLPEIKAAAVSVWNEVEALLGSDEALLPCLRQVILDNRDNLRSTFDPLDYGQFALLSPSVRHVTFEATYGIEGDTCISDALLTRCPDWEGITVKHRAWTLFRCLDVSKPTRLRNLECCEWVELGVSNLTHLATWSALESLSFTLFHFDPNSIYAPPSFSLPNLTSLTMNDPYKYATLFVNLMQLPSLRTLSYVLYTTGSDPNTPLDAVIAAYPDLTTLTLTLLRSGRSYKRTPRPRPCVHLSHLLAPLAPLRHLRALHIAVPDHPFGYSAADLRTIANAWPALVELRVEIEDDDEEVESEDEAKPGLEVLAELARGCPDLRVLHLPRTVLVPGALDAAGVGLAAHCALHDLFLGVIEVRRYRGDGEQAEREVRAFVKTLFPNAERRVEVKEVCCFAVV